MADYWQRLNSTFPSDSRRVRTACISQILLLSEALRDPGSPQRTRVSGYAAPDRTARAAFFKQSRMEFDNAINLDRKSGVPGKMMIYFRRFPEGRNRTHPQRH
jgi:hypothetical protein